MKKVFIYALKHPVTGEIRYVGLTRFPAKRFRNEIHYAHTRHLRNWITSLKNINLKPKMETLEETDENLASSKEQEWIAEMRSRGCDLINYTNGGEKGYECSEQYRAAVSAAQKGKKRKPLSPEHKLAISISNRGKSKPWNSERITALNKSRKGIPLTESTRQKLAEIGKRTMVGERLQKFLATCAHGPRKSRFTEEQKREIKFLLNDGYSTHVIAKTYGLSPSTVSEAKRGLIWKDVKASTSASCIPAFRHGQTGRPSRAVEDASAPA
jgi:DNA-binding NarL/FixJ family response regulator